MSFQSGGKVLPSATRDIPASLYRGTNPKTWYKESDESLMLPVLFTGKSIEFKIAASQWSKTVRLGKASSVGTLEVEEDTKSKEKVCYALTVAATDAPGKYRRTKVITFYPNYSLVNSTGEAIAVAQVGTKTEYILEPNDQIPFHWPNAGGKNLIKVRFLKGDLGWSNEFYINELQHFEARMINTITGGIYRLGVKITLEEASTMVILSAESKEFPEYLIDNQTDRKLEVKQQGAGRIAPISVSPGSKVPFVWDEITQKKKKLVLNIQGVSEQFEYNFDKLREWPPIFIDNRAITVEVLAEGPTKVLRLIDKRFSTATLTTNPERIVKFSFNLSLDSLGISIIDETPQELLYICLEGIKMGFENSQLDQTIEFKVMNFQVDNDLYLTPYPIAIFSVPAEGQMVFHFTVVKSLEYESIDYYNYLGFQLQELDVRLEENLLLKLLEFVDLVLEFVRKQGRESEEQKIFYPEKTRNKQMVATGPQTSVVAKMLYFELFHINPIKAKISFLSTNIAAKDPSEQSTLEILLRRGGLLANIDAAPLMLNGLILKNPFSTKQDLIQRVVLHYVFQGVKQFYKLLGSADFIGNPISLVNNFGTGVYDFFYEPANALVSSPQDFTSAVAKGSKSLVSKTIFGVFNSMSKIGESMTNVAVQASLNKEWQQDRARAALAKPQHVGEGVTTGLYNLAQGVGEGVVGIFAEPIKGAKDEGVVGLAKGVGRGMIGAVLRPAVGVVDLLTKTTEGIRNTAAYLDESKRYRVRWPRYFGKPPILRVYDHYKSCGSTILKTIFEGNYSHQIYKYHAQISKDQWVLISNFQLFLLTGTNAHVIKLQKAAAFTGVSDIIQRDKDRIVVTFYDETKEPWELQVHEDVRDTLLQQLLFGLKENREKDVARHAVFTDLGQISSSSIPPINLAEATQQVYQPEYEHEPAKQSSPPPPGSYLVLPVASTSTSPRGQIVISPPHTSYEPTDSSDEEPRRLGGRRSSDKYNEKTPLLVNRNARDVRAHQQAEEGCCDEFCSCDCSCTVL